MFLRHTEWEQLVTPPSFTSNSLLAPVLLSHYKPLTSSLSLEVLNMEEEETPSIKKYFVSLIDPSSHFLSTYNHNFQIYYLN